MRLASIFTDHMVLQRDKEIVVWGTCNNDSKNIVVTLNGNSINSIIKNGKWTASLPKMEAGGPYEMNVTNEDETIIIKDIMLGDVWLAGGQSNMELKLKDSLNGQEVVKGAGNKNIRYYNTPRIPYIEDEDLKSGKILQEENEKWNLCTKETAGNLSAVAYYFAKDLSKKLGVTIGIIDCNWGGTSVTCWISREYLDKEEAASSYLKVYDEIVRNKSDEQYDKELNEYNEEYPKWVERVDSLIKVKPKATWVEINEIAGRSPWPPPMGRKSAFRPAGLYKTMLSKVSPYGLKGFIYYQGEEDTYKASLYSDLMVLLIKQWRDDWQEKLPFLFVQLPMFIGNGDKDDKYWAVLRDEQKKVYKTVEKTGLAIGIDCGEFDNIHPVEKETIGSRLAVEAFKIAYGIEGYKDYPEYKSHEIIKDKILLYFNNMGNKIKIKGDNENINSFEIADASLNYLQAKVEIIENTIILSNDEISKPENARYAWTNYGETPIYSEFDLPLVPFTTYNNLYVNTEKE